MLVDSEFCPDDDAAEAVVNALWAKLHAGSGRDAADRSAPNLLNITILQNDGPDRLGMRCNALPEHQMALITSGRRRSCWARRSRWRRRRRWLTAGIPAMDNPYCSCKLRSRWRAAAQETDEMLKGMALGPDMTKINSEIEVPAPPTAWTVLQKSGPNHLGLW